MPSVANPNPDRARRGAVVEKPEPVIEELLPIRAAAAPTTAALAPGPSQVAPIAPPPQPKNAFGLMAVRTTRPRRIQSVLVGIRIRTVEA